MGLNTMDREVERIDICSFPVSTWSLNKNYQHIVNNIKAQQGQWIVTLNLEMIYRANKDEGYRELLETADLIVADGVPLIWISKWKRGEPIIQGRSNGTDLAEKLLKAGLDVKMGVIGGVKPEKAVKKYASAVLHRTFIFDGKVALDDKYATETLVSSVLKNKVQLLFLNLGVPKQDILAEVIRKADPTITVIGVGGSFDILAGLKPRAPKWMQKSGLEWLFRLMIEPKRLAKRYLIYYPQAIYFLMKDLI